MHHPLRHAGLALAMALLTTTALPAMVSAAPAAHHSAAAIPPVVHSHTVKIDGVDIFYREAGPANGPVVLLLHGYPTSSRMFRRLMPALADRYHVIAPDYPGFGQSAAPDHRAFAYTFAHYADIMDGLMGKLGVTKYALYSFDYGAPVSYRLALKHPERVSALIVQNGNAYAEGLQAFWDPMKVYWADGSEAHRRAVGVITEPEAVRAQYTFGVKDISRLDPDTWDYDQILIDRPGNKDIQFYDYRTNLPLYPQFQAFFRKYQPPTLIIWGKNDEIFPTNGAEPYLRDLPHAEYHLLDTGHFLLEDKFETAEPLIHDFLDRKLARRPSLPHASRHAYAKALAFTPNGQ